MEQWKLYLNDAKENIESAKLLFTKSYYGLSSYHAQQTIELIIKSYGIKFGFIDNPEESSRSKTHLPSKLLLPEVYAKAIEVFNQASIRTMDFITKESLINGVKYLEDTKKLLKKIEKKDNFEFRKDVWKYSLKIPIQDNKINHHFEEIQNVCNTKYPFEIIKLQLNNFKDLYRDVFHDLRKKRQSHHIENIKSFTMKITDKHNIPQEFVGIFFVENITTEMYDVLLSKFSAILSIDILNLLYGKDGMLEIMKIMPEKYQNKAKLEDNEKLAKLTLLSSLSDLALLTYAHEEFGRYSRNIDGVSSGEIYTTQKNELLSLIMRCESAYLKIDKYLRNFT